MEMQRDLGYAELQQALGQVDNSLGVDPFDATIVAQDLQTLAESIESRLGSGGPAAARVDVEQVN